MRVTDYIQNHKIKTQNITNINGEVWISCVGYNGIYMVSNFGRVLSLEREIKNPNGVTGGTFRVGRKILKTKIGTTGYYSITLCYGGAKKDMLVHRLVASAFIPNPLKLPYINHKNFNKLDNRVENLEWCDQRGNVHHAIKNGKIPIYYGEDTSCAKLTNKQALEVYNATGYYWEIAKKYSITRGSVGCIKSGKTWGNITGKKWERKRKYYKRKQ